MTHIFERVALHCPYAVARRYVQDDALRAVPSIPSYTVHIEPAKDPLQFDKRLYVEWTPEEGAPFPRFTGQLILRVDAEARGAVLELIGDYLPPYGAPGRAFDLVLGNKIASATAKNVLRKMADAIEHHAA